MSVTCACGSVKENHREDGNGCKMCSCPQWRECYHSDSRMECLACSEDKIRELEKKVEELNVVLKKLSKIH